MLRNSAPSSIARNTELPNILPDENGNVPYCVASLNPNGIYSIATLGRTLGRSYFIPKCDVKIKLTDIRTMGIFGEYNTLTLETNVKFNSVLMQDIAGDLSYNITEHVQKEHGKLIIPGELIHKIGTQAQPNNAHPSRVLYLN